MGHRPTKQELRRQQRGDYVSMPAYSYRATGELSLMVDRYAHSGLTGAWKDHPRRKLEAQLNDVMLGLRAMAHARAAARQSREESARRNAAFLRQREELRNEIKREKKAVKALIDEVDGWQQAKAIRAYLVAVKAWARREGAIADYEEWIAWAHDQADRLDPLCISSPSVLDTPRDQYREPGFNEFLDEDGNIQEA